MWVCVFAIKLVWASLNTVGNNWLKSWRVLLPAQSALFKNIYLVPHCALYSLPVLPNTNVQYIWLPFRSLKQMWFKPQRTLLIPKIAFFCTDTAALSSKKKKREKEPQWVKSWMWGVIQQSLESVINIKYRRRINLRALYSMMDWCLDTDTELNDFMSSNSGIKQNPSIVMSLYKDTD